MLLMEKITIHTRILIYVIISCCVNFLDSIGHLASLFICNLGHVWIPLDVILVGCTLSINP